MVFTRARRWLYFAVHRSPFLQRCLIRLGSLLAIFFKDSPNGVYLIFTGYSIGGAEWVHKEILSAVQEYRPWVLFSRPSEKVNFYQAYRSSAGRLVDVSRFWQRKVLRFVVLGWLSTLVNRQPAALVFGSLSPLLYELLPLLKSSVRRIDLSHNFDGHREFWQTPCAPFFDMRIVISRALATQMKDLYRVMGIPSVFDERIRVVRNGVTVPPEVVPKEATWPLRALYVGRGGKESGKRVELIGRVAKECAARKLGIAFTLVGPGLELDIEQDCLPFVRCPGPVSKSGELEPYYRDSHVLVLLSRVEGIPIAIAEAMAHGVIPIATNVGAIAEVVDSTVGFLIESRDQAQIVADCVAALASLIDDTPRREALAAAAHARALSCFSLERFRSAYREIFAGGSAAS